MEIRYYPCLPYHSGEIVEKYKSVLSINQKYKAYTLDGDFNIVEGEGSIENNGSWNYHNNYDDSRDELYFHFPKKNRTSCWWTLNLSEVKELQKTESMFNLCFLEDKTEELKEKLK